MSGSARWWFVGDLHLDPGGDDPRGAAQAFAGLVRHELLADRAEHKALVLLGDTFELRTGRLAVRRRAAASGVAACLENHHGFREGLQACLDHGVRVHLVCGNHDAWLMVPDVSETLLRELAVDVGPRRALVSVHPWVLHEPGLFYAEHGNQHHEPNRIPLLLLGAEDPRALAPTPLEAWEGQPGDGLPHRLVRLGATVQATRVAESRAAGPEHTALVRAAGVAARLAPGVAQEIHAGSRFAVTRTALATGGRVLRRRIAVGEHDGDHDSYLRAAAERVDAVMTRSGTRPLCYVFGHTHQERVHPIGRDGRAWYANTGTWSTYRRGGDGDGFPYVVVSRQPEGTDVELRHWRPTVAERIRPAPATAGR